MKHKFTVDNAIILAAGYSSRFSPLSQIAPKGLWPVRGEILIERQIRQLQEAGIKEIYLVTGYKKEKFDYLKEAFGVHLLENPEFASRNNHASIWAARDILANSYICSSDNYFTENVFSSQEIGPYYSAVYGEGATEEYCLSTEKDQRICKVVIGGHDSWYMLGHVLLDQKFSSKLLHLIEDAYDTPEIRPMLWEHIYMQHINEFNLYMKKYDPGIILEFDSVKELASFDAYYQKYL